MPIFNVQASVFTGLPADFVPTTPRAESSCGDCLTDDEILREIGPIMQFGLGVLIARLDQTRTDFPDTRVALEYARSMFMVRNNDDEDQRGRRAAVKALGLEVERKK
jgi:hypothetical protein